MTRAFGYLRVSGKGQLSGDGFSRQRESIEAYAQSHDLKIVRYFEEQGVSGTTEWDNRPAFVEMIAALNGVKTIVVERLDRLARDLGVQEYIIRELTGRQLCLLSTCEADLGDKDPTRTLFRQIMGAISQFDKAMITAKLRAARDRIRKREGKCEGRKFYGQHPDFPQEREIIDLMLAWRKQKYSFHEIAIKLNLAGVSTRESGKWYGATVSRIVKRESLDTESTTAVT